MFEHLLAVPVNQYKLSRLDNQTVVHFKRNSMVGEIAMHLGKKRMIARRKGDRSREVFGLYFHNDIVFSLLKVGDPVCRPAHDLIDFRKWLSQFWHGVVFKELYLKQGLDTSFSISLPGFLR